MAAALNPEATEAFELCKHLLPIAEGGELTEEQISQLREKVLEFGSEELKAKFANVLAGNVEELEGESSALKNMYKPKAKKKVIRGEVDKTRAKNLTFGQEMMKAVMVEIIKGTMKIIQNALNSNSDSDD